MENEREGDHGSVFQPFIRYGTDMKEANAKMWTLIKVDMQRLLRFQENTFLLFCMPESKHGAVNLSDNKKRPFPLCVTEQKPNICLSGNTHDRLPLLIPLTFTEQRVE